MKQTECWEKTCPYTTLYRQSRDKKHSRSHTCDREVTLHTSAADIRRSFVIHMRHKYEHIPIDQASIDRLVDFGMKQIQTAAHAPLEEPIDMGELLRAIKKWKPNKAPMQDGLSLDLFQKTIDLTKRDLLTIMNNMYIDGQITKPKTWHSLMYTKNNSPNQDRRIPTFDSIEHRLQTASTDNHKPTTPMDAIRTTAESILWNKRGRSIRSYCQGARRRSLCKRHKNTHVRANDLLQGSLRQSITFLTFCKLNEIRLQWTVSTAHPEDVWERDFYYTNKWTPIWLDTDKKLRPPRLYHEYAPIRPMTESSAMNSRKQADRYRIKQRYPKTAVVAYADDVTIFVTKKTTFKQ